MNISEIFASMEKRISALEHHAHPAAGWEWSRPVSGVEPCYPTPVADPKPLPSDEIPRCPWPEQPTAPGDERDNEIATLKAKLQATAFDDWQIALRECDQRLAARVAELEREARDLGGKVLHYQHEAKQAAGERDEALALLKEAYEELTSQRETGSHQELVARIKQALRWKHMLDMADASTEIDT
jgi:hypothetical protein